MMSSSGRFWEKWTLTERLEHNLRLNLEEIEKSGKYSEDYIKGFRAAYVRVADRIPLYKRIPYKNKPKWNR